MALNLKLTERGLILVACPLVLELVLILALAFLITAADNQANRLDRYRNILARAANIVDLYFSSINYLTLYAARKDEVLADRYAEVTVQISEELDDLMDTVAANQKQRLALARANFFVDQGLTVLEEAKREIDTEESQGLSKFAVFSKLHRLGGEALGAMHVFRSTVENTERITPESAENLRRLVRGCLIAAALVAIAFITVSWLFYKGITERLGNLLDNTHRLKAGEALNPVLSGADEVAHLDTVFHDMAAALQEASRKERAIVDNAVDVICSIDPDGKFLRVNPAAKDILGYEQNELTGRSLNEIIAAADIAATQATLARLKETDSAGSFECRLQRQDGKLAYILWAAHWSQTDQCWFCVAHDITDRKELEQLRQQFVSMVSHDLRTPLNSVQNFFYLLNDGAYGEVAPIVLNRSKMAETNVERLIRLVNDLLDTEKIEAGRLSMSCRPTAVAPLLEAAMDAVRGFAEQQEVGLASDPTDLHVLADGDRIVQVLVNFLGNAIKFSPAESTVKLTAQRLNNWIEIRVTDQGRGIPESHRHLIFDKFEQVEADDAVKKGGAGLGLAISRAIVEAHGGSIGVESQEGKGSSFWIRIVAAAGDN